MTRNWKTGKNNRTTYKYMDEKGNVIDEIVPTNKESEMLIEYLHQMDDEEVDANRREEYKAPVRYESYSALADDEMGDHNPYLMDSSPNPLEQLINEVDELEHQEMLKKLEVSISKLLPQQQELICKIYFKRMTRVAIAKEENVTEAAIRNRLNKIVKKIKKDFCK